MDALTSLLHEDATLSMPPFDLWLQGPDEIRAWFLGHGHRLQGLAAAADRRQRLARRSAQYRPSPDGRLRAVGAPGARDLRRADRRSQLVPRHPAAVPAVRAAGPARRVATSASPKRSSSSRSSREGSRSRTRHPSRRAVSWRRASASIVPAFGCVSPPTSQTSTASPERSSSERARSHRAAASAGVSGPLITSCLTLRGRTACTVPAETGGSRRGRASRRRAGCRARRARRARRRGR